MAQTIEKNRHKHWQAYEKAIKGRFTLNIRPVRVNHVGMPRSGKTCFRRRLMGAILNIVAAMLKGEEFQPSTGVAEAGGQVYIRDMCSDLGTIQSKVWSTVKNFEEEVGMFNQFIYQRVHDVRSTTSGGAASNLPLPIRIASFQRTRSAWKKFVSLFDRGVGSRTPSKEEMEETFSVISEVMKDAEWDKVKYLLEGLILLINTDTGSQAEFLDLQASLVLGPSLNLLYRRLVDELHSQFETYTTQMREECLQKRNTPLPLWRRSCSRLSPAFHALADLSWKVMTSLMALKTHVMSCHATPTPRQSLWVLIGILLPRKISGRKINNSNIKS